MAIAESATTKSFIRIQKASRNSDNHRVELHIPRLHLHIAQGHTFTYAHTITRKQ